MESTFIIKKEDFNSEFVEAVKKLFSKSRQLQITINTSEDFDLLKPETGKEYLNRLKKAIDDVEKKRIWLRFLIRNWTKWCCQDFKNHAKKLYISASCF